jgi:hypothetical protein
MLLVMRGNPHFSTRKGALSVVRWPQNAEYLPPLRMEYCNTGAISRNCGVGRQISTDFRR